MDKQTLWSKTLARIKTMVNETQYNHWILSNKIKSVDELIKTVYLENNKGPFYIKLIKDRYLTLIENSIFEVVGEKYKVIIKSPDEYDSENNKETIAAEDNIITNTTFEDSSTNDEIEITKNKYLSRTFTKQRLFNPNFTFENFVVGPSNELAYSACMAVAKSPLESYNPLFIYGGSGLGKTHLMHAIGIHLMKTRPELNILYVDTEMFTNELIKAIQETKLKEFKNKYRKVDVLLVDDIQFLAGKESTQEEFFHTFNSLYGLNKQIIISGDRPPNKLTELDVRLTSRFAWKMVANISPADYETRVAILAKKAENNNVNLDDDCKEVINFISSKVTHNIRELEGAFTRVLSFSIIENNKIDLQYAKRILHDTVDTGSNAITLERIKSSVSKYYKIKISDIESSTRKNTIAYPRQIAMYLCREMTDYSFEKIGNVFGKRHYSTVMHACDKIEADITHDDSIKEDIKKIKDMISE